MKIGVAGASGYSGGELLRLLSSHPSFKPSYISAGSNAGELITSVHQHLTSFAGERFASTEIGEMDACDLLFLALPHGESGKLVRELRSDVKIVDLGADFRINSSTSWEKYYGGVHSGTWTYGLPELPGLRVEIANSSRVANPGCYATSIALAAAPVVQSGIIDTSDIVVVASSGTTGAGRSAKVNLLGSEVMNSLTSYKFGGVHQHTPEIEESLQKLTGDQVRLSFTPILAPMPRGILSTVTAKLTTDIDSKTARAIFQDAYSKEAFVNVLPEGLLPRTSSTIGSNSVHLQVAIDDHTNRIVISAAIDNLGKGAAAQAIQNANIIFGLEETLGLSREGFSS